MRSIIRRIRRLEAVFPKVPPPRPPTDAERLFAATINKLLSQMDPEQARLVWDDLKNARQPGTRYARLTGAVIERVWLHLKEGQPLALPPEVIAVYMTGKVSSTVYDCEDCGYEVPISYPDLHSVPPTPPQIYFPRCPLCNGKTGWHAFYSKHKYCTPAELKAATGSLVETTAQTLKPVLRKEDDKVASNTLRSHLFAKC